MFGTVGIDFTRTDPLVPPLDKLKVDLGPPILAHSYSPIQESMQNTSMPPSGAAIDNLLPTDEYNSTKRRLAVFAAVVNRTEVKWEFDSDRNTYTCSEQPKLKMQMCESAHDPPNDERWFESAFGQHRLSRLVIIEIRDSAGLVASVPLVLDESSQVYMPLPIDIDGDQAFLGWQLSIARVMNSDTVGSGFDDYLRSTGIRVH
jgi:hypothetical protein